MEIHHLSEQNSVLNHFLTQIRDVAVQKDSMRFRRNIERIGEIMAYEISKSLLYKPHSVETPLGIKKTEIIEESIVICSVLRAGLPFHTGFLNCLDQAENGFISAARFHPNNDDEFEILVQYEALPNLTDKTVLLVDPMLATGHSLIAVIEKTIAIHKPKKIIIAAVIAAPEGIDYLKEKLPSSCEEIWIAAIDSHLNEKKYIVPGLGDAGDLAFGNKL